MLRIEDTDKKREVVNGVKAIARYEIEQLTAPVCMGDEVGILGIFVDGMMEIKVSLFVDGHFFTCPFDWNLMILYTFFLIIPHLF